jgi:8-oxo-dGTP pyrophosphatase MutT (NUDIX family)
MVVQKAGCILVDKKNKKIALIYRTKQNDYSFPKGHLEKNETLIECAIRETIEETKRNCEVIVKEPLVVENYVDSKNCDVKMHYYLALDKGASDNTCDDRHDLIWTDFNNVEQTLSYQSLKTVWNKVKNTVNEIIEIK